jgi:iron complex transport system ATP-binding protein
VVSASLVEAAGLEHVYPGPQRALGGVDLALRPGELLAVIGPNGSGKSTLVRCLAGLIEPTRGAVALGGAELKRLRPRERALRVAVVPQYLPALPDLTVEAFALGGRYAWLDRWRGPRSSDVDAVRRALADCDAGDLGGRLMGELSGGQRQRVLIARALAQESAALLVDEPTSSLDPEHQVRVFALLERLVRGGRGALVVTHDLNLASQFAQRIALLGDGRVVASGAVEDVLRREVLEPVYGPHLYYGRGPGARPFVLPWLERDPGSASG